jgi:predicted ATP-grasp superfamily ATP-dependent carboligase
MRRAIAADFACMKDAPARVVVTLDASLPEDPGPWVVARIAEGEHERRLRELAHSVDFTVLLAPETSGVLARLTHQLAQAGARMLGSSVEAVELTGDKARLAARLRALQIDTPPVQTIVLRDGLPTSAHYPAVFKPIDGAGSALTFYLAGPGSIPDAARHLPAAILQPFVPGHPSSASFLVACDGRAWPVGMGAQRIALRDGRFEYQGGMMPALCRGAMPELQRTVRAVPDLRGFVGVDFIWDEARRSATILEINPRPTTSIVGLCRLLPAGHLARAWLEACWPSSPDCNLLGELFELTQSHDCVSFDADGLIVDDISGIMA